jgi:hypothetical protein
MAQQLRYLAHTHNVAVVVTNQMAVGADRCTLIPALGASWAHQANHRLELEAGPDAGTSVARLTKSATHKPAHAAFCITSSGIRSCPS